jgi:conjugative relaxase-like TrwC/TraI family protein
MSTVTTLHAGHDVAYLTSGQRAGGCVGAMSYYTASGEPPGQWAGKAAAALGLTGQVDPAVIARLYQHNIGPGGELLVNRRQSRAAQEREAAAVTAYLAAHPYASAVEVAEVRAAERGADPHQVPYFDLTVDVVKSVSVLHASYRVAARQACERGDHDQAAALDKRADEIEAAVMDAARDAVAWLERHATYTRTGHHSARTGEWRDGDGLVASTFLHHISRDGDPHLHVHVAIWNRVQRADGADEKWRTLDSRSLHHQRLALAPVTARMVEARLSALGYIMVPREDGNGAEVGGVAQDVMDLFSSRSRALTPELKTLISQYQKIHGKPPSKRTIWLLGQQAAQNTRRTKAEARRTVAGQAGTAEPTAPQRLAAWEAQTARQEVQELSAVHQAVARFAAAHAGRAPAVLDDAAKRKAARIAVAEVQQHHAVWSMAQLRFEVHRALPVLTQGTDAEVLVTEVAELAVCGRAGTEVIQVTTPDLTDVTSLGVRALRRGQHLPAAERRTVLQPGPPGHRTADPHRRHPDRAAARHRGAGACGRRAHRADRRAARRRGHHAHRHHRDRCAGRSGRGGQEPHHGRVRPAVDHVHRSAGDRAGHGHQRGPGPAERGAGRVVQHRAVPRQDRRLRRAAPARAAARERRAGAG